MLDTRTAIHWPDWLNDVQIEQAAVPLILAGATANGVLWQAAPGCFLIDVPDIARYLVKDGTHITIEPAPKADGIDVFRYLKMAPLAALLYQRGWLVLHAAALVRRPYAVLLSGDSGAGKSTLLALLLERGWSMLADDLTAIDLNEHGQPIVWPTSPEIVLWQNAIEKLGLQPSEKVTTSTNGSTRHILTQPDRLMAAPQSLRAIYWLAIHNRDDVDERDLTGADRFRALGVLSYNSHIADALIDRTEYFRRATVIAQSIPIRRLMRPRGRWSVPELADSVEQDAR